MKNLKINQFGMVPIIYIVAAVVVVALFATIFYQVTNKKVSAPPAGEGSPATTELSIPAPGEDCADRDYTGCDGVDVIKWTDDGKR